MEQLIPYAAEAVSATVLALCAAVTHLYRMITKSHQYTRDKLAECEKGRKEMQEKAMDEQRIQYELFRVEQKETYEKISDLNNKVGQLEGMKTLHDAVIQEIRKCKSNQEA